jgi:adenylate cyclase
MDKVENSPVGDDLNVESPDERTVRAQLERILSSDDFAQSLRMQRFLSFIVDETLAGNSQSLKEYTLAVDVFDRDNSFDPQTSSLVRVEASRLRAKLDKYNATAGRLDPITVTLPAGGYVPQFVVTESEPVRIEALDQPAVAVLPFTNMSGDPAQDYFADGLTEDIITALSGSRLFPVIARNSTFTYKVGPVKVQQVASELGARYVIEGGVQKAANRVRVTAQLIDAESGHHIMAEKFDRDLEDIFELQDDLTQRIASNIVPSLELAESRRLAKSQTRAPDAWDWYLRGKARLNEMTKQGSIDARNMFEQSIKIDPNYARAHAETAYSHYRDIVFGYSDDDTESLRRCEEAAQLAVSLDDDDAWCHVTRGMAYARARLFEQALVQAEKAVALDPTGMGLILYGYVLNYLHRPSEGIPHMTKGIELSPKDPRLHFYMSRLADAHLQCGEYEQAIDWARKIISQRPDYFDGYLILAVCLALRGVETEARAAFDRCKSIEPNVAERLKRIWFYVNSGELDQLFEALRKVGLED